MSKDYKIPIAFIILILIIIFGIKVQAQNTLLFDDAGFIWSYTPELYDTNYYQVQNIQQFLGDYTRTKVADKDTGASRFVDYTKVWLDSMADSVRGKTYNLSITEDNDSTWFYWQYYGYEVRKDTNVWKYSAIDSVFTPDYYVAPEPDHYYIENKDGGKILMKNNYAIKFKD